MVGINPAKVSDDLITRASIGYGETLGLKFTQARSEDVIKLTRKYTTVHDHLSSRTRDAPLLR
jgi:hypothetical protein